jgi:hypothetical protein
MKSKQSERSTVQISPLKDAGMRQSREARGVTLIEMQNRLYQFLDQTHLPSVSTSVPSIARYEKDEALAPQEFKRLYARALGLPANRFLIQQKLGSLERKQSITSDHKTLQLEDFARAFVPSQFLQDEQDILDATRFLLDQVSEASGPKRITFVVHHPENPMVQSEAILGLLADLAETHFVETIWPDTGLYGDSATTHALIHVLFALGSVKNQPVIKSTKSQIGFDALIIDDVGLIVLSSSVAESVQEKINQGWMITKLGYEKSLESKTLHEHIQENVAMLKSDDARMFLKSLEKPQLADLQFSQPFSLYRSIRDLLLSSCDSLVEYHHSFTPEAWVDWERKLVTFERRKAKMSFLVQPFLSSLIYPESIFFDEKSVWYQRTLNKFERNPKENILNLAIFRSDRASEFAKNLAKNEVFHLYQFSEVQTWIDGLQKSKDNQTDLHQTDLKLRAAEMIVRLEKLTELLIKFPKFHVAFLKSPEAIQRLNWNVELRNANPSKWQVKGDFTVMESQLATRNVSDRIQRRASSISDPGIARILTGFFLDVWNSLPDEQKQTSAVLQTVADWVRQLKTFGS